MSPQKVRYQWFRDIPRNVTRREYEQWQLRNFGAIALGMTSALMAFTAISGATLWSSRQLAEIDAMTVAEAIAYQGEPIEITKIEGFLVADDARVMPDDAARKVIRGKLSVVARGDRDSEESDGGLPRETLFAWEEGATTVFLSNGSDRLPLGFDLAVLPMPEEPGDLRPKVLKEGESARTRSPVAVEYGEMVFPLSEPLRGGSAFVDVEREVLPYGQTVVVVAKLESTAAGNQLADPLGDRLQVKLGSEAEIQQEGEEARVFFGLLCIPLGAGSFFLHRSSKRLWQEFVVRSNE